MAFLCDIKLLTASTDVLCVYGIIQQNMCHAPYDFSGIHIFKSSILAAALPRTLLGKLTTLRQTPHVVVLKRGGGTPAPFVTSLTPLASTLGVSVSHVVKIS